MSASRERLIELGREGRGGERAADAWADYLETGPEDYSAEDAHYRAEWEHDHGRCDRAVCPFPHAPTHREVGILHSQCDPDSPWAHA
jgi:hypothetical protein